MRTEEISIYNFNELSDNGKEKAREWYKDGDSYFETEQVSEDFKYELSELGYPTEKVYWSLSYCQGDGVAFYGRIDDVSKVAARLLEEVDYNKFKNSIKDFDVTIEIISINSHYNHWNSMSVESDVGVFGDVTEDEEEEFLKIVDHLVEAIDQDVKDVSRRLEDMGYKQFDYFNSNEYIDESITANDYEFAEDGKFYTF